MITALVGIMLALAIGIACRWLDIPVPAPPRLQGALLVVAVGVLRLVRGGVGVGVGVPLVDVPLVGVRVGPLLLVRGVVVGGGGGCTDSLHVDHRVGRPVQKYVRPGWLVKTEVGLVHFCVS